MDASITSAALQQALRSGNPPLVIDVRKQPAFLAAPEMIRGALRRDPEKLGAPPATDNVVVYCVHGHEVSQGVAKALGARYLEGGIEHWDGERMAKPAGSPTRWVTRERPTLRGQPMVQWQMARAPSPEPCRETGRRHRS
jgi:rhodanese-related sulfurtransferase